VPEVSGLEATTAAAAKPKLSVRLPSGTGCFRRKVKLMGMIKIVDQIPLWVALIAVTGVAILYSVGLMLLARYLYGRDRLSLNNEVAGFKFAVIGVFYGLLLAFVVIAVWEEYQSTETAVRNEAKAVADLHEVAHAFPGEDGKKIHERLSAYVDVVLEKEWPAMAQGEHSKEASEALEQLGRTVFAVHPQDQREMALYQEALRLLALVADNRTERLDNANGSIPGILWFVLIIGGIVTLAYPAFFASTSIGAQILMTAALAGLVALALLIALMFDFPFTGDVRMSTHPFEEAKLKMQMDTPIP
jgi:hypothetical protein